VDELIRESLVDAHARRVRVCVCFSCPLSIGSFGNYTQVTGIITIPPSWMSVGEEQYEGFCIVAEEDPKSVAWQLPVDAVKRIEFL
jgi:hypothetical protein